MEKKIRKEDTVFYYQREKETNHPRVTVCLLNCGTFLCRGIAICSDSELSINKKRGRRIAFNRAMIAYHSEHDSAPIKRLSAVEMLRNCKTPFPCKSQFSIELTPFENSLMKREQKTQPTPSSRAPDNDAEEIINGAKKMWEYMKALQTIGKRNPDMVTDFLKKKVDNFLKEKM